MILAKGEKTYIKALKKKHIDSMGLWGRHKDPLFYSYNFPLMSPSEKEYWYSAKNTLVRKRCFVIYNYQHRLIGYISLRDIKMFRKTSVLGIVFDPSIVGQGYGTDGLKAFLTYYFEKLKMREIYLKVAAFNLRAKKCYQKCGFKSLGLVYENFEDQQLAVFTEDYFIPYRQFFKRELTGLKCQYISMVLSREKYFGKRENYPQYPP